LGLLTQDNLNNFSTILLSIILEGFPFIIIGALVSSLIQVFVSEDTIRRVIPRNKFIGMLSMALIGVLFPICECGIVPITRRLIKKGVPVNMAVTFMLSVPIVNPVVLLSTYYAFLGTPSMVVMRAAAGIVSAVIIGWLIEELHTGDALKKQLLNYKGSTLKVMKVHNHEEHDHNHDHHHHNEHGHNCDCGHCSSDHGHKGIMAEVFGHASHELYDIGRFFIIGATLSALMQTFIPKSYILQIGGGTLSSILTMMVLAFLLSVCSETDAFIARTFAAQFTKGSILAFLIFGPMIDIKNTIMLTSSFNLKFVVKLIFLIFSVAFLVAVVSNFIPFYSI
jgi:uncharacterized protein